MSQENSISISSLNSSTNCTSRALSSMILRINLLYSSKLQLTGTTLSTACNCLGSPEITIFAVGISGQLDGGFSLRVHPIDMTPFESKSMTQGKGLLSSSSSRTRLSFLRFPLTIFESISGSIVVTQSIISQFFASLNLSLGCQSIQGST